MKQNLPNLMWLGAVGALGLSSFCKDNFPETLGRVLLLHWGCGLVSAILFSIGLFLSLYGLFSQKEKRKRYILPCLSNLASILVMLTVYFTGNIVFTKIYHLEDTFPSVLPKLIENSQTAASEEKRIKAAQFAYELYGVKLTYLRQSGDFVSYEPSEQDVAFFKKEQQIQAKNQELKQVLKGSLDQYPYLFAFYIGALFLTFFIGSLWLAFKKPTPSP